MGKGVRHVPQFDYNIPGGSNPLESEGRNQVFKIRTYELGTYVLLDEGLPLRFYHPHLGRPHRSEDGLVDLPRCHWMQASLGDLLHRRGQGQQRDYGQIYSCGVVGCRMKQSAVVSQEAGGNGHLAQNLQAERIVEDGWQKLRYERLGLLWKRMRAHVGKLCRPSCLRVRISQDVGKQGCAVWKGVAHPRKSRQMGHERSPWLSISHCWRITNHYVMRVVQNPWTRIVNTLQGIEYEWELVCCTPVETQHPVL